MDSTANRTAVAMAGEDVVFLINPDDTITAKWKFGTGAYPPDAEGNGPHTVIYDTTAEGDTSEVTIEVDRTDEQSNNCHTPEKKTASVIVPKLELKEVSFSGGAGVNHRIKNITNNFATAEGADIQSPEWKEGETPKAVCYTKATSPKLDAKFKITPDIGDKSKTVYVIAEAEQEDSNSLHYDEKELVLSGTEAILSDFTTTDQLGNAIDNTNYKITWKVAKHHDAYENLQETSNQLFVVLGTPSKPTYIRLNRLTKNAKGSTEQNVADILWKKDIGYVLYNLRISYDNPWILLNSSRNKADCKTISNLMKLAIMQLGVQPSSFKVVYLFVRPNGECYEADENLATYLAKRDCYNGCNGHTNDSHYKCTILINNILIEEMNSEELPFADHKFKYNNYEACFVYGGVYYAPGTRIEEPVTYSSAKHVLNNVVNYTAWHYYTPTQKVICTDPGKYPEHIWY